MASDIRNMLANHAMLDVAKKTRGLFETYGYDGAKLFLQTQIKGLEKLRGLDDEETSGYISDATRAKIDSFFGSDNFAAESFIVDTKLLIRLKCNGSYQRAAEMLTLQLEIVRELSRQENTGSKATTQQRMTIPEIRHWLNFNQ